MVDLSRARREPYAHQIIGVERMVELVEPDIGRIYPGCFMLADDMRLGKTKQVIDTAQVLYTRDEIDRVIVVAPAPVRSVWFDPEPEFGELAKHLWEGMPCTVYEYHARTRSWKHGIDHEQRLIWIITNYEFIRSGLERVRGKRFSGPRLDPLLKACDRKTLLVLDETSAVSGPKSLQTKACTQLRQECGRIIELNGTPISHSPANLFSQAALMDKRILGCESFFHYRSAYAVMGGWQNKQILGWRHDFIDQGNERCYCDNTKSSVLHGPGPRIEDIQRKLKPYVLRRIRSECLDLPPKLEPVTMTVTLTPKTWRYYRELRDDLITWLSESSIARSAVAGTRVMRLSQITSGFVGGTEVEKPCGPCGSKGHLPDNQLCEDCGGLGKVFVPTEEPTPIGREKLKWLNEWLKSRLEAERDVRMLVWVRFKPECMRVIQDLQKNFDGVKIAGIHGGQSTQGDERKEAMRLMHPESVYDGPAVLIGTLGTGSVGVNLAGAHEVVYLSNDNSLFKRKQSEDRPHGPGQTQPVSYHDVVAEGPKGQRTIDHQVVKALHAKQEIAQWTTAAWVHALKEE